MNRLLLSLTIAAGLFHLSICQHPSPADTQKDLSIVSNNFTVTFLKTLLSSRPKSSDFLVSAFNIQEAIFPLLNGAKGRTYAEIARLFNLPNSPSSLGNINAQFRSVLKQLQVSSAKTQVELATALFVQKKCPLRSRYVKDMSYYYAAKTETVDFQRDSVNVLNKINSFVNQKTHGKIPKLYEKPLPPDTKLVLCAVLYFNSSWYNDFFKLQDQTSTFNLLSGEKKQLQYLNNHNGQKRVGYTIVDSCSVVRILYDNTNYSLFVFRPPRGQDPAVCLQGLNIEKIDNMYSATEFQQYVNVTLPRFAFNSKFENLVPDFVKLGVRQAFVDANLGRAIDQCKCGKLGVSQIMHKCRIEVSEKGTMAVAVTGISVRSLAVAMPISEPIQFIVDRPFAFIIASKKPKLVLFAGICVNPIYPNH